MFSLQFDELDQQLEDLLNKKRSQVFKQNKLNQILNNYCETASKVKKCNEFWRIFLLGAYFVYIALVTMLLYVVLYAEGNEFGKIAMSSKMVISIVCLAFLAFSGDIVSRKAHKSYVKLCSITVRNKFSLKLQSKVFNANKNF